MNSLVAAVQVFMERVPMPSVLVTGGSKGRLQTGNTGSRSSRLEKTLTPSPRLTIAIAANSLSATYFVFGPVPG